MVFSELQPSNRLLKKVVSVLRAHAYHIENVDVTVIAQKPRLAPYIDRMRERLSTAMEIPLDCVSVKATTEEHLGFTGEGLGIAAHAVALITREQ